MALGARMSSGREDADALIDRVYDIAVAPERLEQLIDGWTARLNGSPGQAFGLLGYPALAPHVERAELVLRELDSVSGYARQSVDDWADACRTAAIVVTRDGTILAANAAGRETLRVKPGKSLREMPLAADDLNLLAELVAQAHGVGAARLLRLRKPGAGAAILMRLVEKLGGDPDQVGLVSSVLSWPDRLSAQLRETFVLTDAEADVLKQMTVGHSVKEIAGLSGRSEPTIRTHVQALLNKTGARSQLELVRVTLGLLEAAGDASVIAPMRSPPGVDPDRNHYLTLTLPCGRRLDYLSIGAARGRMFLMLPSDAGFTRLPREAEDWLAANGMRMIVPVRAGYGHSSPLPKRRDAIEVAIEDMLALCSALRISRCPLLTKCDDFHLAVAYACAAPERVSAIVALGPTMPAVEPKHYARMSKFARFVFANARYAPRALPFLGLAMFRYVRRLGPRRFMQTALAGSPADQKVLEDDATLTALVQGSEICVGPRFTAHAAWARGAAANYGVDWSGKLRSCPVPMILYAGREDPFAPIETTREFAAEIANITLHEFRDRGQLLYPEWRSFLAEVERRLKAD
jgi:pimeloyl-ACP methyl ester carboxylesterase/DNA-binding CsgD family transcriptional regulator